jgi:hypothetical protein
VPEASEAAKNAMWWTAGGAGPNDAGESMRSSSTWTSPHWPWAEVWRNHPSPPAAAGPEQGSGGWWRRKKGPAPVDVANDAAAAATSSTA